MTPLSLGTAVSLALLAVAAPPAHAAPPEPQPGDVVVVAPGEKPAAVMRDVLETAGDQQIARYERPACPGVSGLPLNLSLAIVRAIRANATAAGLKLQEEGCQPDAIVVFVDDPRALVAGLRERHPGMFGQLFRERVAELSDGDQAVRSWHFIETLGRDGELLAPADPASGIQTVRAQATRLTKNVSKSMAGGYAVIDRKRIQGKTVQQLADVATLHLFLDLDAKSAERAGDQSVLSLFLERGDGSVAPAGLTVLDRGMLAGLYRPLTNNFNAQYQRARMLNEMERQR